MSSITPGEKSYVTALECFKFEIRSWYQTNPQQGEEFFQLLQEKLSIYDPEKGPLYEIKISDHQKITECIQNTNKVIKNYLDVDSKEEMQERQDRIKQDFKSLTTECSIPLETKDKGSPFPPEPQLMRNDTPIDPRVSPEKECPLIREKIENPTKEITIEESIQLLTTCVKYGDIQAKKTENKQVIIIIGNTGAGKSTFVNYLCGCEMELKRLSDLKKEGINTDNFIGTTIVRVKASSEQKEVMKIGHTNKSETFIPEIITDKTSLTYCDCPGFLDNRGPEINIANAVNIKTTLQSAHSIKVIILINYKSLEAERGRGFKEMIQIACNLFGSRENLLKYQNAILLGITQIPKIDESLDPEPLQELKNKIITTNVEAFDKCALEKLSERLFIYDPLGRKNLEYEGALTRGEIIGKIVELKSITSRQSIFQTVLNDSDEKKLIQIAQNMQEKIKEALAIKDFKKAASLARDLKPLKVIEHRVITKILLVNQKGIEDYFSQIISEFKLDCAHGKFSQAENRLTDLENGIKECGPFIKENIESLRRTYQEALMKEAEEKARKINKIVEKFDDFCGSLAFDKAQEKLKELEDKVKIFEENYSKSGITVRSISELQEILKRAQEKFEAEKQEAKQELQELERSFYSSCQSEQLYFVQKTLQTIKERAESFKNKYSITGIELKLNISELQEAYKKFKEELTKKASKAAQELLKESEKFEVSCQYYNLENAKGSLKRLSDGLDTFEKRYKATKVPIPLQREALEKRYEETKNSFQEIKKKADKERFKLIELGNNFDKCCRDFNCLQAQKLLGEIRNRLDEYKRKYEETIQAVVPCDVNKLEEKLLRTQEKYKQKEQEAQQAIAHMKEWETYFLSVCQSYQLVDAEKALQEIKTKVEAFDKNYKTIFLPTPLNLPDLEKRYITAQEELKKKIQEAQGEVQSINGLIKDFYKACNDQKLSEAETLFQKIKASEGGFDNRYRITGVKLEVNIVELEQGYSKAKEVSAALETQRKIQKAALEAEKRIQKQAEELSKIWFGKAKWEKYFGDIGVEPSLPSNILEILNSPCIFWPDKKVKDTHLLVLIPNTVNGKAFHLDSLGELIQSPKSGHKTQYSDYDDDDFEEYLGTQSLGSYWVLMTREVIPESRNKTYDDQKALVQKHAQKSKIPYELPKALEAATVILMHHVETGERLYPDVWTRCEEKVNNNQWAAIIGGFSSGGLSVNRYYWVVYYYCGLAACRKL